MSAATDDGSFTPSHSGPECTVRSVLTGVVLGAIFSVCNLYVGLKAGLVLNMSVPAALLGFGLWAAVRGASRHRLAPFGVLENNINQTACSAGGSVASAGLITAIPTLTILTQRTLPWHTLTAWVASVCLVGILIAVIVRRQMIIEEKLTFPVGVAAAETLRSLYAHGSDAAARVLTLLIGAVLGAGVVIHTHLAHVWGWTWRLAKWGVPGAIGKWNLGTLTFALDPSPLFIGLGGLLGFRTCAWLLLGAAIAFGGLAPVLLTHGVISKPNYQEMVAWLVWPGVTLMTVSALVSFAFSWRSALAALRGIMPSERNAANRGRDVPASGLVWALVVVTVLSVMLQVAVFDIAWYVALLGVALAFVLVIVAARVTGETGITPVAPIGKLSQIAFGAAIPQQPAANLMAANVAGGAASQCADLLQDLKCGHVVGSSPRAQTLAQLCGALAGAAVACAAYLVLVPDPARDLLGAEFPAPGVRGMKAVAELFQGGFKGLPEYTPHAMIAAAILAAALSAGAKLSPPAVSRWIPSGTSMGAAFVMPASYTLTIFVGGLAALLLGYFWKRWTARFLLVACSGLVTGDPLAQAGIAFSKVDWGGLWRTLSRIPGG